MKKISEKISAAIPLFNKEYSISQCIESINNQTLLPKFLYVINDGSTDSSLEKAKKALAELKTDYLIISQNNSGVSDARNKAIKLCKTDFISFLDADDFWHKDYIKEIDLLIEEYPDADIYCTAHKVVKNNNEIIYPPTGLPKNYVGYIDSFFKACNLGEPINSSKATIKTTTISKIGGFPSGISCGEDLFVWINIAKHKKVCITSNVLVTVNQLTDNSRTNRNHSIPYPLIYFSKNPKNLNKFIRKYLFKIYRNHILHYSLNKDKEMVVKIYHHSRPLFPIKAILMFILAKFIPKSWINLIKKIRHHLWKPNNKSSA